ncbi:G-protein coupled receptor 61-like [Corythoichthys intestinalis]|uniref:G-protein coupled receptor 61-like n=1 Tax=Corythoichthys intestinalis TaxID=161448 RepID=UPI0025A6282E|nr:G-protein coupled receptor 61-like [Corythoichthys intestinalis]XP_057702294.1 G-protein coupled receptor 61-like [Corythoichthys intestinalis]XP_057702295.1 G-protein coupled receptor 61-like [Corythoichthys intestinalis]XP_061814510.1 G-protein coupled receptor 61-like [Nerophis lumbriciformis]
MEPAWNASNLPPHLPSNMSTSALAEGWPPSQWLALTAMLLMDLLAVVGNVAVMTVIAKVPQLHKFAFVFHLCLVDLLAALVLMPLGMVSSRAFFGEAMCRSYLFLSVFLVSAAILSISVINVERYYYIIHPMRYEVKMTVGLVASVLVGIWVKALAMSALPLLAWVLQGARTPLLEGSGGGGGVSSPPAQGQRRCSLHWTGGGSNRLAFMVFFTLLYFLCPLLVIFVVYCNMFKVARVAAMHHGPLPTWTDTPRRRRSESLSSRSTMVTSSGTGTGTGRETPGRPLGGGKAAAVLAGVGGQFLCCWLPYFSFHLYSALAASPPAALASLEEAVTWIGYFCFTSNPFFYGCLNRQIREELGKHLPCLFRRAGLEVEDRLPSREGSIEENFLQFLQGTGCNLEPQNSHSTSSPKGEACRPMAQSQAPEPAHPLPADFRIPGQIAEETYEFIETDQAKNNHIDTDT